MLARWLSILLVAAALAAACGPPRTAEKAEPDNHDKVLVTVNGAPVTARDVERRIRSQHGEVDLESLGPDLRQRMAEEAVEAEILDRLLLEAAREEGVAVGSAEVERELERAREVMAKGEFRAMLEGRDADEDDFRRFVQEQMLIRAFQERLFAGIEVEEGVLEEYFEGHPEKFREPARVRLHVVVLPDRERAAAVMAALGGGRPFEELADELAQEGLRVSRTRPMPLEAVPPGLRAEVVGALPGTVVSHEAASGEVSIARVLEKTDARQLGFGEAEDLVRSTIVQARRRTLLDDWYGGRLKTARIEYHDRQEEAPASR